MTHKIILILLIAIITLACLETTVVTQTSSPTSIIQKTPIATSTTFIQTNTPTANEIKTALEIKYLENQNTWGWINSATLISTLALIIAGSFKFYQWSQEQKLEQKKRAEDQQFEREKRAEDYQVEQAKLDEERFQAVVGGLGSERIEARVGAAIMLLTFLHDGYERFYKQTFLLAAAHLRLRRTEPGDALGQALILVFKDAFNKARDQKQPFVPETLDATGVHLDNAYLSSTDLRKIRMRSASLRGTHFWKSQLQGATLKHSDMESAILGNAHLEEADLGQTNLKNANLTDAHLHGAHLHGANLESADFSNADLTNTFPEHAKSLEGTILINVKGLSAQQLQICATRGAIIHKEEGSL